MGAWSVDSFGNDTANDWAYGLEDDDDLGRVREAIQKILDAGPDYLEAPDAEEAIAAIEVMARLRGNFGKRDSFSEKVDNWVQAHSQTPPQDLVNSSSQALDRILTSPSELLELWEKSYMYENTNVFTN